MGRTTAVLSGAREPPTTDLTVFVRDAPLKRY
jgi:hypothetical protein